MQQEFLTLDNIGNFAFQLFAVMSSTEFSKRLIKKISKLLGKENKIPTDFIVFGYSLILSIIKTLSDSQVSWDNCRNVFINLSLIFMNSLIISYLSTASYSKLLENNTEKDTAS